MEPTRHRLLPRNKVSGPPVAKKEVPSKTVAVLVLLGTTQAAVERRDKIAGAEEHRGKLEQADGREEEKQNSGLEEHSCTT